jgi:chemotaxis-related protein WspD
MKPLPLTVAPGQDDCWNRIGVHGDRTCPELAKVVHCHNCPIFAAAGRRFLDAPSPEGYLDEWADRLAAPAEAPESDLQSVLVFRLGEEWLALPVGVLAEVTPPRPIHRVPHRGGLLAGVVNIRGELHLVARLDQLLGIETRGRLEPGEESRPRLLVVRRDGEGWVFPVDEVDQVRRVPVSELSGAPATISRASARLTRGVFVESDRAIGLLDDTRLFLTMQARLR